MQLAKCRLARVQLPHCVLAGGGGEIGSGQQGQEERAMFV
jgi:hypothetical protein